MISCRVRFDKNSPLWGRLYRNLSGCEAWNGQPKRLCYTQVVQLYTGSRIFENKIEIVVKFAQTEKNDYLRHKFNPQKTNA